MESAKVETGNIKKTQSEFKDVLIPGRYLFHWAKEKYFPKILSKGLYAPAYARQIGDEDYQSSGKTNKRVPFLQQTGLYHWEPVWPASTDYTQMIGIIADVPESRVYRGASFPAVDFRIAPRFFIGLMVVDKLQLGYHLRAKPSEIEQIGGSGKPLILKEEVVLRKVEQVRQMLESQHKNLPIYGTSGDLYWPSRIRYTNLS